jgi:hypothetical protein
MNLADNRLTEEDIITHCDKSNAEEIIAYIFRDLGSSDHGITDEVRLKNFRILLNSEQVQEQIQKDNFAAVHNLQLIRWQTLYPNVAGHWIRQNILDSLQAAVNEMAQNGKIDLLGELLQSYPWELSQVTIPHEAIFLAAEKGDTNTVDLILRTVRGRLLMRVFSDISYYDDYLNNALKGSIAGVQFDTFKRIISLSDSSWRIVKFFPHEIALDLLNKNLSPWLDYALSNSRYIIDTEKSLGSSN